MTRALTKKKGNGNYSEEIDNKKYYRNRVLLGVKRGPIFENKKVLLFEKEVNKWVVHFSE